MVLMRSLCKIGYGLAAADEQVRFFLDAFHQPLCYHPPTKNKELRLSSRWAHKIAGDEDEVMILFGHQGLIIIRKAGEEPLMQIQCN